MLLIVILLLKPGNSDGEENIPGGRQMEEETYQPRNYHDLIILYCRMSIISIIHKCIVFSVLCAKFMFLSAVPSFQHEAPTPKTSQYPHTYSTFSIVNWTWPWVAHWVKRDWDFPDDPVVRTLCFHCWGPKFDPWSGNYDHTGHVVQPKRKKREILAMMSLRLGCKSCSAKFLRFLTQQVCKKPSYSEAVDPGKGAWEERQ